MSEKDLPVIDGAEKTTPDASGNGETRPSKVPKPIVRRSPEVIYHEAISAASVEMAQMGANDCLEIVRVKRVVHEEDSETTFDGYSWSDRSKTAMSARKKIRAILEHAWSSCALNYDMIARSLRVSDLSVKGLLDLEFREANGL